jgi:orotate phosphoribosyltransferase
VTAGESLARRIYERSHLTGEFLLRSGVRSGEYFDKYLFESDPVLLREIALGLSSLIPAEAELLAGLELGGVPLALAASQVCGLPTIFVRKEAKQYGTRWLAEGGDVAGRQVVVVEDVVTSGGQVIESCGKLRQAKARIARDRPRGGRAREPRRARPRAQIAVHDERSERRRRELGGVRVRHVWGRWLLGNVAPWTRR